MGVLDNQSLRGEASNRKLGPRRLEHRAKARRRSDLADSPSDRRRPGRGTVSRDRLSAAGAGTGSRGLHLGDFVSTAARVVVFCVALPIQLLFLLTRPRELVRRFREGPARMRSLGRRLQVSSRDPHSTSGRLWESGRLAAHFVREEVADMQDGFPSRRELRDVLAENGVSRGRLPAPVVSSSRAEARMREAVALGLVIGLAGVGLYISTFKALEVIKASDRLAVASFEVRGTSRVDRAALIATLDGAVGDNLLELDLDTVGDGAVELPWVDTVTVTRDLRARTVAVHVVEHQAALLLGSTPLRLIDDRGRVFKRLEAGDPWDLPLFVLEESVAGSLDARSLRSAAAGAVDLMGALTGGVAVSRDDISEIRFDGDSGYTVVTHSGLPIHVGISDFSGRFGRLERAVADGGLPLDALASLDLGMRDRFVAVPRTQKSARRTLQRTVLEQAVGPASRARILHLDRIRRAMGAPSAERSLQ